MTHDTPVLYHFTSRKQAARIDRGGGILQPGDVLLARRGYAPMLEGGRYVWLISEPTPEPRLVGFNDHTDHLAVRYVVRGVTADWWPHRRREHSPAYVATLEAYALPALWWVVEGPVQAVRDSTWQDPTQALRLLR